MDPARKSLLQQYLSEYKKHQQIQTEITKIRTENTELQNQIQKNEDLFISIQQIGMETGEVLKNLGNDRVIVQISNGPHYVVGYKKSIDPDKLTQGTRVALDMTTHTIMKVLPREVHASVSLMSAEDPGNVKYDEIGGLRTQMREIREVIELPMTNPELFERVGVKAPKGVLLYGPPGTGKTLLARAMASNLDCHFLKIVASGIMDKYLGESARLIREMFQYARDHEPCIIFIDEIDAIAGKRMADGMHGDREVQRTLMELLAQMDGFTENTKVKVIMATNRPDTLDPALMKPGRLDRKIEIGLPNHQGRIEILKIHSKKMAIEGNIDFDTLSKLADGFNGADLRNVCTEAGMFAIRDDRDFCIEEDFFKAVRKVQEAKKVENQFGDIKV